MNSEALLASQLSSDPVASLVRGCTTDELAELVKEATGAACAVPVKKTPPKPKSVAPAISEMKQAVKSMTEHAKKMGFKKSASAEDIVVVAGWARELAHRDLEKAAAGFGGGVHRAAQTASRAAWAADRLKRPAQRAADAWRRAGPGARAAVGAAGGGAAGAALGGGDETVDREGRIRRSSRIPAALTGASMGAAAGALSHPVAREWVKGKGRDVASKIKGFRKQSQVEKVAIMAALGQMAAKAAPYVGRALGAAARNPMGRNALYGAAGGAVLGGTRHLMRSPQERQQHSLLGSMAGGAALGGAGGAAAGPFAQKVLQRYGGRPGTTAQVMQRALPAAQQVVNV